MKQGPCHKPTRNVMECQGLCFVAVALLKHRDVRMLGGAEGDDGLRQ